MSLKKKEEKKEKNRLTHNFSSFYFTLLFTQF